MLLRDLRLQVEQQQQQAGAPGNKATSPQRHGDTEK
jgi:hypothetical protein